MGVNSLSSLTHFNNHVSELNIVEMMSHSFCSALHYLSTSSGFATVTALSSSTAPDNAVAMLAAVSM